MSSRLSQLFRRMSSSSSTGRRTQQPNRLAIESSPYLQQHKFNPVDWYPWGQDAFKAAKESNKPILLSIGYSTCHWCHVMECESFENQEIAEIMNRGFVNIKVDREERPDVDRHYMAFVQGITGSGGWPLTVFLAPDLTPFFGGTYFPPTDSGQQLGFPGILRLIQEKWSTSEEELKRSGTEVLKIIERASVARAEPTGNRLVTESRLSNAVAEAAKHYEHNYDRTYGGFGSAPKFPTPPTLSFLLRLAFNKDPKTGNKASEMLVGTLEKMAQGGIHDHIEGGFHRYSVDRQWHLPHFEKMLYDQGQLMNVYSSAYALRPLPIFKTAVHGIYEYVTKHLQSEGGAFFCAEDADSIPTVDAKEKKEGAFALWSQAEIEECLGKKELYEPFINHYGVHSNGNIDPSKDPHGEMTGLNVLDPLNASGGNLHNRTHLEIEEILNEGRHLIAARRAKRPRPSLDDKILTAWNGLMISGLVRAYRVFGLNDRYIIAAQKAADFIIEKMYDGHIGLHRIYKANGQTQIGGFADDYAYFIQSLLDLYEATLEQKYLDMADNLQTRMTNTFWDGQAGVFVSSKNPELPMQHIVDDYDGAEPSSNSVSALNLGRLYLLTENAKYKEQQAKLFDAFSQRLTDLPQSMPSLLDAFLFTGLPPTMAVIDAASIEDAVELKQTALSTYNHGLVLKANIDSSITRASAHVCKGTTCSSPVYDSESFAILLKQ